MSEATGNAPAMEDASRRTPAPGLHIRKRTRKGLALCLLLLGAVLAANYVLVHRPVAMALSNDARNAGYTLHAHYRFYIDPSTLVLNLTSVDDAAPVDLLRGVFSAASALHDAGRTFERVILARSSESVFIIEGVDFDELGAEFAGGQNPIYLLRTFPEKLFLPTGQQAFGTWEGGILSVVGEQMEDVTEAASTWAVER